MNQITCENDWWKWGEPAKRKALTDYPKLITYFEQRWGKNLNRKKVAPAVYNVTGNEERAQHVVSLFGKYLPQIKISNSPALRLKKSAGKSYPDLLAAITNSGFTIPDAVVYPKNHTEVLQILQFGTQHKILVVPFGGGSNVVRAFMVENPEHLPQIVLDLAEMNSVISIDEVNHTATFESGIFGPALEKILNQKHFTLGHFPQSFEYSTLGGWIATRSAGQESSAYGRIEDIIISLKVATPAGEISTSVFEGDAEGISIKSLFYGCEAALGVVTEAKVRIHPLPENKKWLVAVFPSYRHGLNAIQQIVQQNIFPSVVRYSDENETFFLSLLSHEISPLSKLKSKISKLVLQWKNMETPSLMMIRLDGEKEEAEAKRKIAADIFKQHRGSNAGEGLGKKWETSRFGLPYLRDDLMERGIFVDTMETVVPWNKADALRKKLHSVLLECEAFHRNKGILLAHVSHVYTSSASLYFTVLTSMNEQHAYEQWKEIKTLVTETIVKEGGAVSHHHSIGTDHRKWYLQKTDALTKSILKSVKQIVDPNHILNPGKLFDE